MPEEQKNSVVCLPTDLNLRVSVSESKAYTEIEIKVAGLFFVDSVDRGAVIEVVADARFGKDTDCGSQFYQ